MSQLAFVLIDAAVGKSNEIANTLHNADGVNGVYVVMGPHSLVAMVEGDDVSEIGNIVTSTIHSVPGVERTVTLLSISAAKPDVQVLPPPD